MKIPLFARVSLFALALASLPLPALAQHAGHGAPTPTDSSASIKAFEAASANMHKDMAIAYTGDADVDFVRGMIPHHQGAIDMARVVIKHGKDPAIRKLAQGIIVAQEKEIAQMRGWLKQHTH